MFNTWIHVGRWCMAEVDCRYPVMRDESMAQCSGALFEDLDFPCADSSLFSDSTTPIARLQGEITWRRPQVSFEWTNVPGKTQWRCFRCIALYWVSRVDLLKRTGNFPMRLMKWCQTIVATNHDKCIQSQSSQSSFSSCYVLISLLNILGYCIHCAN